MSRFTTFFFITYYYSDRASGLLPNKKVIRKGLLVLFCLSIALILVVGIVLWSENPSYLCENIYFQTFRLFPMFILLFFILVYRRIKHSIEAQERNSELGKKIYLLQCQTMHKVKFAIIAFFICTLLIFSYDQVARIAASNSDAS